MSDVAQSVSSAVQMEPDMFVVNARDIENQFASVSKVWGMHRPEHVASLVGYSVLSMLNCIFGGEESWLPMNISSAPCISLWNGHRLLEFSTGIQSSLRVSSSTYL